MKFFTKIKILYLPFSRDPDDSLKKKNEAICPYCGKKGRDHIKELSGTGTTQGWGILNCIYLTSCYNNQESMTDWKVIKIWKFKFTFKSYSRGFVKFYGYKWKFSLA